MRDNRQDVIIIASHKASEDVLPRLVEVTRGPHDARTTEEILHAGKVRVPGAFKQVLRHPTLKSPQQEPCNVGLSFAFRNPPPKIGLANGRLVKIPYLHAHPEQTLAIFVDGWALDLSNAAETQWVEAHLRPAWELLQPRIAFADRDTALVKNGDPDPEGLAWPWMIYGPEMIAKWGEEHLRKAPVWRVEKLDYGGMLVQVAENPFTATRRQVKALADHLGLEAPR